MVEKKLAVIEAMESQFFEGGCCDVPAGGVPTDAAGRAARAKEVRDRFAARFAATAARFRAALADWYGAERAEGIRHAEAFEICEYGRQPTRIEIARLFPFFPPREEAGGAWVPLFNGKDLAGWKPHGAERWAVDNGEILGETLTKEYGYLSTEKTYRDFELKAKFKAEGTGNSGIFYHSTLSGTDISGVQAEVDPRAGMHSGGLYEAAGRGWLIKPDAAAEKALRIGTGTTCASSCAVRTSGRGSTASPPSTMWTRAEVHRRRDRAAAALRRRGTHALQGHPDPRDPSVDEDPRRRHLRHRLVRERAHQGLHQEPAHAVRFLHGRDEGRVRANLARYGVDAPEARFTKRYEDLLEADDVDIVSITTPNHLHAAQAVAAARAGKHFVLEKPTGLDTRELVAIRDAVRKARVRTIVSFELHYNPYLRFVHWLRKSGRLGKIRFARVQYLSRVTDSYAGWKWVRTRKSGAAISSPRAATPWTRSAGARGWRRSR